MVNSDIVSYISGNLKRGISWEITKNQLLSHGHNDFEINEAVAYMNTAPKTLPESGHVPYESTSMAIKWILVGVAGLALIFLLFFVFGKLFSGNGDNMIHVSEDAIKSGANFPISKKSVIDFEYAGSNTEFEVDEALGIYSFSSDDTTFALTTGQDHAIDVTGDGVPDFDIVLSGSGDSVMMKVKEIVECTQNWECADWTICIAGVQRRGCVDQNNCGEVDLRPDEEKNCTMPGETKEKDGAIVDGDGDVVDVADDEQICIDQGFNYTEEGDICDVNGIIKIIQIQGREDVNCCEGWVAKTSEELCTYQAYEYVDSVSDCVTNSTITYPTIDEDIICCIP